MLCSGVQYNAVQWRQFNAVQWRQYNAVQWSAINQILGRVEALLCSTEQQV